MSILIIGMEMPPQGEFKHIRIYDNGEVTVQVDTGKEVYEAVIANAVQIPPHGRLIDADALMRGVDDGDDVMFVWAITDAPTIIEAEGREA